MSRTQYQPAGTQFTLDGVIYVVLAEGDTGCKACTFNDVECHELTRPVCTSLHGSVVFKTITDAVADKLAGEAS